MKFRPRTTARTCLCWSLVRFSGMRVCVCVRVCSCHGVQSSGNGGARHPGSRAPNLGLARASVLPTRHSCSSSPPSPSRSQLQPRSPTCACALACRPRSRLSAHHSHVVPFRSTHVMSRGTDFAGARPTAHTTRRGARTLSCRHTDTVAVRAFSCHSLPRSAAAAIRRFFLYLLSFLSFARLLPVQCGLDATASHRCCALVALPRHSPASIARSPSLSSHARARTR